MRIDTLNLIHLETGESFTVDGWGDNQCCNLIYRNGKGDASAFYWQKGFEGNPEVVFGLGVEMPKRGGE